MDEAITELREALRLNAENLLAHSNLGDALRQKGDWAGAAAELREALRLAELSHAANQEVERIRKMLADVEKP